MIYQAVMKDLLSEIFLLLNRSYLPDNLRSNLKSIFQKTTDKLCCSRLRPYKISLPSYDVQAPRILGP